jgi:hypothetical protein
VSASPAPDRKTLVRFGLLVGGLVAVLFGLLFPWLRGQRFPVWPWAAAAVLCVCALGAPAALAPAYRAWMAVGSALGWVNTRLLLGAVFFLVVTPIGAVMRMTGRDPMHRKFEPGRGTYRIPSARTPRERMEVPF